MGQLLDDIISTFTTINLQEAEKVKLFNRSDTKYIFHQDYLNSILEALLPYYTVLEAGNILNQPYYSIYFDTPEFSMYLAHHNRRPTRYKMRIREYTSTGTSFLEIKQKTSKGKTIKSREKTAKAIESLDIAHESFIGRKTPFNLDSLQAQLITKFNRITLISKDRPERITLDTNLEFIYQGKSIQLTNLVIVELKRESSKAPSEFPAQMKKYHIRPLSVSKYCLGMALLNPNIKHNLFKRKLTKVQKITQKTNHDTL
jgi:hypothetical protein